MGISLIDNNSKDIIFDINFWHWRAIVEEIRRQDILSNEIVDGLHEPFCGNGLNKQQCCDVYKKLMMDVIPKLSDNQRILIDGERTYEKDDFVFHREEVEKNYSTNKQVLAKFCKSIENCNGFEVY